MENIKIKQNGKDVIESIYVNRNINDEVIDSWLYANSESFEEPENYPNMDRAYKCLMEHINKHSDIFVLSDCDNDGVFSSGTLINFILKYLEYENVYYLVHDEKQHGITKEVINKCKENKVGLLITPDAGSSDIWQMEELIANGIDVIALDHHQFDKDKVPSKAIVVNNQYDEVENKHGSGTLVTYKFIYYVAQMENIDIGYDYLDACHVANISDMMELNGSNTENRYIFNLGKDINNATNPLIKNFIKDLGKKKLLTMEDVQFGISPKINAIIRCGTMEDKEDLMEGVIGLNDETITYKYRGVVKEQSIHAAIIRIGNRLKSQQKRKIDKYMSEGLDILTSETDKIVIINGKEIESNLRGLLANKLLNEFNKPIMILSGDDELKGSCRGLGDKSFIDLVKSSNCITFAQGHSSSFGMGLLRKDMSKFISHMNKELLGVDFNSKVEVDYVYEEFIPVEDVIDLAELDEVWTRTCPKPHFLVKNICINTGDISKKGLDLSFKINDVLYKKDYCSKVWYEKLIHLEENENIDKDIRLDILCNVKTSENGYGFVNIVEFESQIID